MSTILVSGPSARADELRRGDVIAGRYRIDELLGRGGFAAVFAAQHLGLGQGIALKVLLESGGDDEVALRRFFREARMTSRLQHPNTIRVFDFGQDDSGLVYLAMELLTGETLREAFIERRTRGSVFSEREAITIGVAITRSLSEAHTIGLVHRDLKPSNVFVHHLPGDDPLIKVLDFGIAKARDVDSDRQPLTEHGRTLGTPAFMSPEHILGAQLDGRSDLYSLGVILFLLVSGALPFEGKTPLETFSMHVHRQPPDLRLVSPALSEAFVQVVERALSKRPERRFPDSTAMRSALLECLSPADRILENVISLPDAPTVRASSPAQPAIETRVEPGRETVTAPTPAHSEAAEVAHPDPTKLERPDPSAVAPGEPTRVARPERTAVAQPEPPSPAGPGPTVDRMESSRERFVASGSGRPTRKAKTRVIILAAAGFSGLIMMLARMGGVWFFDAPHAEIATKAVATSSTAAHLAPPPVAEAAPEPSTTESGRAPSLDASGDARLRSSNPAADLPSKAAPARHSPRPAKKTSRVRPIDTRI
jgi:eukaryotic-like serine/threonine-protein kinase